MNLQIKPLSPTAAVPIYASEGAAAFDFFVPAGETVVINPGFSMLVGTKLAMAIPAGYMMLLFSRSGHGAKKGIRLANCVGVIDSDYRGEVMGSLFNDSSSTFTLASGDRFMQGVVIERPTVTFSVLAEGEELTATSRGAGGFGSTGAGGVTPNGLGGFDYKDGTGNLLMRSSDGAAPGYGDDGVASIPKVRPRPRSTHTLAGMAVTEATFNEIANKLREAGYDHVFADEGIDMTGIMLCRS